MPIQLAFDAPNLKAAVQEVMRIAARKGMPNSSSQVDGHLKQFDLTSSEETRAYLRARAGLLAERYFADGGMIPDQAQYAVDVGNVFYSIQAIVQRLLPEDDMREIEISDGESPSHIVFFFKHLGAV